VNREQRRSAGQRGPTTQHKDERSVLDAMTGHRMPGGCDDCHAYQTIELAGPGVYVLAVFHDDTCPELRRRSR